MFIYSFFLKKKNQKFNPPAGGQLQSFSHSKCLRNAAEKIGLPTCWPKAYYALSCSLSPKTAALLPTDDKCAKNGDKLILIILYYFELLFICNKISNNLAVATASPSALCLASLLMPRLWQSGPKLYVFFPGINLRLNLTVHSFSLSYS